MYPSRLMVKTKLKFWISSQKVDKWIRNNNFFFIFGMGRSGTMFLSNLLNKAPDTYIVHEPVRSDFRAYNEAFHSEEKAMKYINKFRKKEMYLRARKKNFNIYGEVNSVLRRHCKQLKQIFPNAIFIHLIRDGRNVVRSLMSRATMTKNDRNTKNIYPKQGDLWKDKWSNMNRFEKLCWYWQVENSYLNDNIQKLIKFEKMLSNYNYFEKNILQPLNIEISKELWETEVNLPKNISPNYKIPHYRNWNQKMLSGFDEICGEVMKYNGYIN